MVLLDEQIKKEIQASFEDLRDPVRLIVFTRDDTITIPGHECATCKDNEKLIKEVAALSDKITIELYDYLKDSEKAKQYNIERVPVTLVHGQKDFGIRLYGIPAGHEFTTLINAIRIVSLSDSGLAPLTREKLKTLSKSVHIQVFVTLSCPYCAPAAALAHRMAIENQNIRADIINAQEFPELAQQYTVFAVPKIIINETTQFEGALSEGTFLEKIITSLN